jgi:hypothetical protein
MYALLAVAIVFSSLVSFIVNVVFFPFVYCKIEVKIQSPFSLCIYMAF